MRNILVRTKDFIFKLNRKRRFLKRHCQGMISKKRYRLSEGRKVTIGESLFLERLSFETVILIDKGHCQDLPKPLLSILLGRSYNYTLYCTLILLLARKWLKSY